MKSTTQIRFTTLAALATLALLPCPASAKTESEIAPIEKRSVAVDKALHVSKLKRAEPLSPDINDAFAPPQFELTDAEEAAAAAAAARQNGGPVVAAPSDRETLEAIASKISPSGTIYLGGHPMLMFGKRFVKTGAHFTVTYKGNDYDLELTDIDGANFTLRYNREEITRPVKPGKSP